PADLDLVELQDTDAAREILSVEELGLCERHAGGRWVRDGGGELGSRLPVNASGGLLAKGEPLGASALAQVVELTWQLRGEAGPEVEPARARRRVEVARRVAVDADLLRRRHAVPREGGRAHLERPFEAAVARRRAAARDAERRWRHLAVGRAAVAGRAVGHPVVALLAALDDAVAALEPAGGGAAVARRGVAVVALFTELLDPV